MKTIGFRLFSTNFEISLDGLRLIFALMSRDKFP